MVGSRIFAAVIVATSLVAGAEARAACVNPAGCFCPSVEGLNTTFSGTIVKGAAGSEAIQVRLDVINLVGTSTQLAAGSLVSFTVTSDQGSVSDGARVIGLSVTSCAGQSSACDPSTGVESTRLTRIAAPDTTFECSGTTLTATADSLAATMASSACFTELQRLLADAGADLSCGDGGGCSARPVATSSVGWITALGLAALVGLRRARR